MGNDIRQMHAYFTSYPMGIQVDILNPAADMIHHLDMARSLSNLCRDGGARDCFLSVAQHSCIVCDLCPIELKPLGLLHDGGEYIMGADLRRALKYHMQGFKATESTALAVILEKYNIDGSRYADIKVYDDKAWEMEKNLIGWPPQKAEIEFLHRFYKYVESR